MSYLFIIVFGVFVFFALKKQKSLKGSMEGVKFYGEESLEIAKTIVPPEDEITFISCGVNMDTASKGQLKGYARSTYTGSTTDSYKYYDYTIVTKTEKHIYFIPVKIVGTLKINLEINPKKNTKMYDLSTVSHTITDEKPNATWHSIDIKFDIGKDTVHNIQFRDSYEEFK